MHPRHKGPSALCYRLCVKQMPALEMSGVDPDPQWIVLPTEDCVFFTVVILHQEIRTLGVVGR